MQVQVKDPDRVRPRNPVEHFGKPLHAPIIGEDPVEVHARLSDALADQLLVEAGAVGAPGVRELVGQRAQDTGHGGCADAGSEEDDDVVAGKVLLFFVRKGAREGKKEGGRGKKREGGQKRGNEGKKRDGGSGGRRGREKEEGARTMRDGREIERKERKREVSIKARKREQGERRRNKQKSNLRRRAPGPVDAEGVGNVAVPGPRPALNVIESHWRLRRMRRKRRSRLVLVTA